MSKSKEITMISLVYRIRKKGFKVDELEREIYYNYLTPEVLEAKAIKQLRKKYNFKCQAEIQ